MYHTNHYHRCLSQSVTMVSIITKLYLAQYEQHFFKFSSHIIYTSFKQEFYLQGVDSINIVVHVYNTYTSVITDGPTPFCAGDNKVCAI